MRPYRKNKTETIYRLLCEKINDLENGETFPSIRSLMKEYSVSQLVVVSAIQKLKERGVLKAVEGVRTIVTKRRKSNTPRILLLQSDWISFQRNQLRDAILKSAERHGFLVDFMQYDYQTDICMELDLYQADLILLNGLGNDQLTPRQILALSQSITPVILLQHAVPAENIRYVCGDNMIGGTLAARYLAEMGHRKLGVLFCEPHLRTTETRVRHFCYTAELLGCSVEVFDYELRPGDEADEQVGRIIREIARRRSEFSALFCISAHGAEKAEEELKKYNISVPDQISILGFGAFSGDDAITSVLSPNDGIAERAILMAKDLLLGVLPAETQIDVEPVLSDRGTVAEIRLKNSKPDKISLHPISAVSGIKHRKGFS